MTAAPRPAAPDTTGGELREQIVRNLAHHTWCWLVKYNGGASCTCRRNREEDADALLAGPLRDLLAERDTLAAQVAEQRALLDRNHRAYLIAIGVDPDYSPMPERRPATDEGTAG